MCTDIVLKWLVCVIEKWHVSEMIVGATACSGCMAGTSSSAPGNCGKHTQCPCVQLLFIYERNFEFHSSWSYSISLFLLLLLFSLSCHENVKFTAWFFLLCCHIIEKQLPLLLKCWRFYLLNCWLFNVIFLVVVWDDLKKIENHQFNLIRFIAVLGQQLSFFQLILLIVRFILSSVLNQFYFPQEAVPVKSVLLEHFLSIQVLLIMLVSQVNANLNARN